MRARIWSGEGGVVVVLSVECGKTGGGSGRCTERGKTGGGI